MKIRLILQITQIICRLMNILQCSTCDISWHHFGYFLPNTLHTCSGNSPLGLRCQSFFPVSVLLQNVLKVQTDPFTTLYKTYWCNRLHITLSQNVLKVCPRLFLYNAWKEVLWISSAKFLTVFGVDGSTVLVMTWRTCLNLKLLWFYSQFSHEENKTKKIPLFKRRIPWVVLLIRSASLHMC